MINSKKLTARILSLIFFIFLMNIIALKFHWYFSVWWFDMLLHFLGGLWLGITFFWIFSFQNISLGVILKIVLSVFLIGLFWEFFEILIDGTITQKSFILFDTLSDLCFDLAGGVFSIFYLAKRIIIKQP